MKRSKKTFVSVSEVKKRLKKTMADNEVAALLERFKEASKASQLDMETISALAEKKKEKNELKVNFTLTPDEYELLSEQLELTGKTGTQVVKHLIKEWISDTAE